MNTNLIKAVVNGLHCDDLEELTGTLEDIINKGVDDNFWNLIWRSDTKKFFLDNRSEIADLVNETASVIDEDDIAVTNALTWFTAEEVARYLIDNPELIENYI